MTRYAIFKIMLWLTFPAFFVPGKVYAEKWQPPFLPEEKYCNVITRDMRTSEKISEMSLHLKKTKSPEGESYSVHKEGRGKIYQYEDASWELDAQMMVEKGFIKPLTTSILIKDAQDTVLERCVKFFDYAKQQIKWEMYGKNNVLEKQKIFPLKGKTCDDVTLIYFLKPYLKEDSRQDENYFYLLTNAPQLFKTRITYFENEPLKLPWKKKTTIKLKLTADMGIIDDLLDKYVPQTYVWYTAEPPYAWLKYQGLEKNLHSRHIETFITR